MNPEEEAQRNYQKWLDILSERLHDEVVKGELGVVTERKFYHAMVEATPSEVATILNVIFNMSVEVLRQRGVAVFIISREDVIEHMLGGMREDVPEDVEVKFIFRKDGLVG